MNFGVDHYRPKSIPKFSHLKCEYSNLYYCCGNCNSRKNADWPIDEQVGPFVVNPCEHVMADHLRFNAATGLIDHRTAWGEHTKDLLQLNEPATVAMRKHTVLMEQVCKNEIEERVKELKDLAKALKRGSISQANYATRTAQISQELTDLTDMLHALTGAAALPPLPKQRWNVVLHP